MTFAVLRRINDQGDIYEGLFVWCPGCQEIDADTGDKYGGLHLLPVRGDKSKRPTWDWNGDCEKVTLSPSILTKMSHRGDNFVCHSYLQDGVWKFLSDCTHPFANTEIPMVPLPDWVS